LFQTELVGTIKTQFMLNNVSPKVAPLER